MLCHLLVSAGIPRLGDDHSHLCSCLHLASSREEPAVGLGPPEIQGGVLWTSLAFILPAETLFPKSCRSWGSGLGHVCMATVQPGLRSCATSPCLTPENCFPSVQPSQPSCQGLGPPRVVQVLGAGLSEAGVLPGPHQPASPTRPHTPRPARAVLPT